MYNETIHEAVDSVLDSDVVSFEESIKDILDERLQDAVDQARLFVSENYTEFLDEADGEQSRPWDKSTPRHDWTHRRDDRHDWTYRRDDRRDWTHRRDDRHDWTHRRNDRQDWTHRRNDRQDWTHRRNDRQDWKYRPSNYTN